MLKAKDSKAANDKPAEKAEPKKPLAAPAIAKGPKIKRVDN